MEYVIIDLINKKGETFIKLFIRDTITNKRRVREVPLVVWKEFYNVPKRYYFKENYQFTRGDISMIMNQGKTTDDFQKYLTMIFATSSERALNNLKND